MRTLKRILVFILFTMALIGVVGGLKYKKVYAVNYAAVFTEGFETYSTGTNYKTVINYNVPDTEHKIGTMTVSNGTVTTTDKISGSNCLQMRLYYNTADNVTLYLLFAFDDPIEVDKITFSYKAGNANLDFDVQYSSTAEGDNFVSIEAVDTANTNVNSYSTVTNDVIDSTLSIRRFRILISGTKPASDHYRFTIDDLVFYAETSAPQLSAPANAAIAGTTLSFDAVDHAVSYNVGFFENQAAESPSKVVNINTTSYTFTQQSTDGFNYIKIQTLGDGVNYLNSSYSNVGTYTYTDIPVKTITQLSGLGTEDAAPYSYYDITGTVSSIVNASNASFNITDGASTIYVYGLAETKGGNPKTIDYFGFAVGDTVRIKVYKSIYDESPQLRGYFVSYTPNYGNRFASLNTFASLKVDYTSNFGVAEANSSASMNKVDRPTIGAATIDVSYAYALGFNPSLFKITCLANNSSGNVNIDTANIRFYHDSSESHEGGSMTIEGVNGIVISKIELTYVNNASYQGDLSVIGASGNAEKEANGLVRTYTLASPSAYATIQNTGTKQARITDLTIYYSGLYASSYTINTETVEAQEKQLVSLMFGSRFTNTLKDNVEGSGTTVTYGIAYAKKTDLGSTSLADALENNAPNVHTLGGTPVKVDADGTANESGEYWQIGVSLNHIPDTAYNTEITAAVYVCIDGTYYLMNTSAYSVKTVAAKYLGEVSTSYEEHLGLLGYLANYAG